MCYFNSINLNIGDIIKISNKEKKIDKQIKSNVTSGFEFTHWPIIKENHNAALFNFLGIGALPAEHVIPAVRMEGIRNQGRSQNKSHLIARHAGLQFGNHFLGYVIALLYLHAVGFNAWNFWQGEATGSAASQQGNCNDQQSVRK